MMVINRVIGQEPLLVGEKPWVFLVGQPLYGPVSDVVTRIQEEEENLGTYGIKWYVAYNVEGKRLAKMNALSASIVEYL